MDDLPHLAPLEDLYALAAEELDDELPPPRDFGDPIHYTYREWSLDEWAESNCLKYTRFTKGQIYTLVQLLRFDDIEYNAGLKPTAVMACCVFLRRLAFSTRWLDLQELFGRSSGWLSTVFTCAVKHVNGTFGWLLDWHPRLRSYRRLHRFANAVEKKCWGRIWGFIDGHFKPMARPLQRQRDVYSGHAKTHGMKFSAIVTPDGMVYCFEGPYIGKQND